MIYDVGRQKIDRNLVRCTTTSDIDELKSDIDELNSEMDELKDDHEKLYELGLTSIENQNEIKNILYDLQRNLYNEIIRFDSDIVYTKELIKSVKRWLITSRCIYCALLIIIALVVFDIV